MKGTILFASSYLPPFCGGAEQVAWEIAKRVTDDFEVHIITTGAGSRHVKESVEVHSLRRLPLMTITYSSIMCKEVKKILKEVSPDIIHVHAPMVLPWGYIFRDAGSIKMNTCHGWMLPWKPERFLVKSALRKANVTTSPSRWLTKRIQDEYGQPTVTIPNGVDTGTFKPLIGVKRSDNVVLFVGRLRMAKGVLDLMEAARALPEYEFRFVGSAEHKSFGRMEIEISRLANVKLVGFTSDRHAMAVHYNQATICAFPSHRENFPLVGLEAMACGKSIVATRLGFSEYVENGREGLLVEPHDIKGLVKSIKYLMENEAEREEFEKNARKRASVYEWETIAKEYKTLYERWL